MKTTFLKVPSFSANEIIKLLHQLQFVARLSSCRNKESVIEVNYTEEHLPFVKHLESLASVFILGDLICKVLLIGMATIAKADKVELKNLMGDEVSDETFFSKCAFIKDRLTKQATTPKT